MPLRPCVALAHNAAVRMKQEVLVQSYEICHAVADTLPGDCSWGRDSAMPSDSRSWAGACTWIMLGSCDWGPGMKLVNRPLGSPQHRCALWIKYPNIHSAMLPGYR